MDIRHLKKFGVGTKITEVSRLSRAPGRHCKRRLWSLCFFILNTACLRPKLTAAKIMDVIAGLPHCVGQAADAVPAYTPGKNGRCSQIIENFQIGMSRYLDTSSTTQMAKIMETIEDPVVPLERNLYSHP